jgi:hypothetical protein
MNITKLESSISMATTASSIAYSLMVTIHCHPSSCFTDMAIGSLEQATTTHFIVAFVTDSRLTIAEFCSAPTPCLRKSVTSSKPYSNQITSAVVESLTEIKLRPVSDHIMGYGVVGQCQQEFAHEVADDTSDMDFVTGVIEDDVTT